MVRSASIYLLMTSVCATACIDTTKLAINSTSKVLEKAQPSLRMESDYEMAARAIPGSLKTVEGFHVALPENKRLTRILAEGYCQYATGFIEDEWERAKIAGDFDGADYHSQRATKAFIRCMNYGLELLGADWQAAIFGPLEGLQPLVARAGPGDRFAMMWTAIGLASAINQNKDDIALVAHLPKARMILERIVEIDRSKLPENEVHAALPHVALAMAKTATSPALGGKPEEGKVHFETAWKISGERFLLARVLFARRYAVMAQDRDLFRQTLVEVLQTDPAIWPEQRLANEIAHRRARRYLKLEKELF
jgi:hypothetical protein